MIYKLPKTAYSLFIALALSALSGAFSAADDYKYESRGKRDPFVPLVGINRPAVSKLEDVTSIADVKVEGIVSASGGRMAAILNDQIVRQGDRFGDIEIKKITKKAVTIVMGGKNYDIMLIEEGGSKSGR
ncbi:MAG: hypothetical protein KKH77_02905 [Candidatus Omnitrophica bacterium]|nr:hypothetical protein [Candidatus Omnitrophota bacterium]MBU0881054.1 hypothetical protein [Candidatus Omnitrophota bacterium]MBU1037906.1 hypothetical protein [Candidatus Omnitrophota bacterium]MBU1807980.1 hypothetical protein [Candidatus Omnitrophota bacterium]